MTEVKGSAFILRVIQGKEADLILLLLTRSGEKVAVFAKAALKSKKRFGGALQPFLNIGFRATKKSQNRSQDLYILEEAFVRTEFSQLTKNMDRLWAASRITELVDKSAHDGLDNPHLYDLYGAALKALDSGLNPQGVERQFEVKLLSIMGWLPQMRACGDCGRLDVPLSLQPTTGQLLCSDCGEYPINISVATQNVIREFLKSSLMDGVYQKMPFQDITRISSALLQAHLH